MGWAEFYLRGFLAAGKEVALDYIRGFGTAACVLIGIFILFLSFSALFRLVSGLKQK